MIISFFLKFLRFGVIKAKTAMAWLFYFGTGKRSKNYWLIGGSLGGCFDDNAGALLKYLREYYPDVKIYWVSNRDNPDIEQIEQYCPVITRNSLKSNLMALRARVLIYTHSIEADIARFPASVFSTQVKVMLDHGVPAFKRHHLAMHDVECIRPGSGPQAREILLSVLSNSPNKILKCGFPQHDELLRKQREFEPGETGRTILFLPTWRKWLVAKKQLLKGVSAYSDSEYFKHVSELLTSDSFNDFLEERDLTIKYLPHRNMRVWADILPEDSRRVKVLPPETSVQDEIVCSDALITDYSSVAWEFLLLDKPVIFYQFDREKYLSEQGSFVDFNTDLFGPAVFAIEELKNELGKLADADFVVSLSEYDRGRLKEEFVGYSHGDNCRIITEHIFDSLKELK